MARIKVTHADSSGKSYHLPRWRAESLIALGRADRVSSREIRLRSLTDEISPELVVASGYDHAVHSDPQKNFNDAWQKCSSAGVQILQMYPFRREASVGS